MLLSFQISEILWFDFLHVSIVTNVVLHNFMIWVGN